MEEKIKGYLREIEKENDVRILMACETGSRAWGFPSPDSDYDVRMIYVHKRDWYLSLKEEKDTIEIMLEDGEFDITGWDLRKSLRLLWKSNAALLERIQSPILYCKDDDFINKIDKIADAAYSRISTIHHYMSMAKKALEDVINKEEYKLKKFFYALRASIACKWILDREEKPPIVFQEMLAGLNIDSNHIKRIEELIALKATISETYMHSGEEELLDLMNQCLKRAGREGQELPSGKTDFEEVDRFFRDMLRD